MHHITASVTFSADVPQPTKGVKSGYIPHHRFPHLGYLAGGLHTYPDDGVHYAGETVEVRIRFVGWEDFGARVHVGDCFEVRELHRLIGHGVVQSIIED